MPRRCALMGRRGRRPLRSVTAHAAGRGALTPPHKGNGFPRQCEHWLGMTRAGRCGGHRYDAGRRDAVPYGMVRGACERDGENAVPCIIFTAYSAWPLCFMTDTTSSTQARQRASSGASTMTRSSGSVPDSRTRMRPVSPRRRATPSTAFCTAGS